jgi:hypothetical protein
MLICNYISVREMLSQARYNEGTMFEPRDCPIAL